MGLGKESLRHDLDYNAWAGRRLLSACSGLAADELSSTVGSSHGSVLAALDHIYSGERFWTDCLLADHMPPLRDIAPSEHPPRLSFEAIEASWPRVWSDLDAWFAPMGEDDLARTISSELSGDTRFHFTRWQLLRHTVNHSTLHRGQIIGMLRDLGKKAPNLDMMSYILR